MPTMHEAVALSVFAALAQAFGQSGDPIPTRSAVLPEDCPPEGLINLRMEDPVEDGRVFGAPSREWSRVAAVEIVAQHSDETELRARFDALAGKVGTLHSQTLAGVDYFDLSAVVDAEDPPIMGDAPVQAGVVQIALYYETGENPLEEI